MEHLIVQALRHRGGYCFRGDLIDLGLRDRDIREALNAGHLERLRHGTYGATEDCSALSPEQRSTLIAHSIVDKLGPGVAISHTTAAARLTGVGWGADLRTIHLTRLDGKGSRTEAGVTFHVGGVVPEEDLVEVDGRLHTAPARAAIEASSLLTVEAGMVQTSLLLRQGLVTPEDLYGWLGRCERWPGVQKVRLAVGYAAPACESVGEIRSVYMFRVGGVPMPSFQTVITDASGRIIARADFEWEDDGLVGEFDGALKYGVGNADVTDPARVVLEEKRREDAIRATGRGVVRWGWRDLEAPQQTCARINARRATSRRLRSPGA